MTSPNSGRYQARHGTELGGPELNSVMSSSPDPSYQAAYQESPAVAMPAVENDPLVLPPSLTATVIVTILFGWFGIIPALIHSQRATSLGYNGRRYWKAFWIIMGIEIALALIMALYYMMVAAGMITTS